MTVPVPGGEINAWHRPASDEMGTVVLMHGLSGNSRWWSRVIQHLPENVGVVALDVRGRGASAQTPPPYDLGTIADDIVRTLDHLALERTIVVGYSMGAWVAALFGVNHPERVERMILVDGGVPMPLEPNTDPEELIDAMVGPSLRRLEVEFESEEAFFDHWKSHPAFEKYWDDTMGDALRHELVPHGDTHTVRANPEAIEVGAREITIGIEANRAASRLNVPAHLIVVERGTLDQPGGMIPLRVAEDVVAANPELTMQYLPGLNHYTLVLGQGARAVAAAISTPS
ncbi:MAG TPA: alpha/beta hydrolase [Acidimicrobiia bacterium]|nr:alpha/beta hydrolase [Acidimicrobiia bacterium]